MIRTLEAAAFHRIVNDPCVRPWLGGTGDLDLTGIIENPDNFALLTPEGDGGYILIRLDLGLYEAHSCALPSARGKPMLTLMRDGFRHMFTASECIEITTRCPDGNPAASRWADIAGFRETYRRENSFDLNGKLVGCSFRSLTYSQWVLSDKRNQKEGERFHERLAALRPHSHPEDVVHDAFVGATIEGIRQGNVRKAVALYSRWAAASGYVTPTVLSVNPPVVHQGDCVVTMVNGEPCFLKVFAAPEG